MAGSATIVAVGFSLGKGFILVFMVILWVLREASAGPTRRFRTHSGIIFPAAFPLGFVLQQDCSASLLFSRPPYFP